jgi:lauroyl/myristoyl acyltransferase
VTAPGAPAKPPATGLKALWRRRPGRCSPPLWATVIALDRLPWPLGEELLARIYLIKSLGRGGRFQRALEWAGGQRRSRAGRWWLAAKLCTYYGRFVSRLMLVGFRGPEHFRHQVVVRGEEHLKAAAGRGVILLGFHLGPPGAAIALRVLGYQLTWARGWGDSQGGLRPAWRSFHEAGEMLSLSQDRHALGAVLYEARQVLVDGGSIYITADGGRGREAFRVPMGPVPVVVRSGWLALSRSTGAAVLPVLTHLEGHRQVISIHEPLPPVGRDPEEGLDACRAALAGLLEPYLREHPEQCYSLVFRRGKKHRPRRRKRPPRPPGSGPTTQQ